MTQSCFFYEDAVELMQSASGKYPMFVIASSSATRHNTITIDRLKDESTTEYVAVGVYYSLNNVDTETNDSSGPCFDFWGFVSGRLLHSRKENDVCRCVRSWCMPSVPYRRVYHASFDLYQDNDVAVDIDELESLVGARVDIYTALSGDDSSVAKLNILAQRILNLSDPESINQDRKSYAAVMSLISIHHRVVPDTRTIDDVMYRVNTPPPPAFDRATYEGYNQSWLLAEFKITAYRLKVGDASRFLSSITFDDEVPICRMECERAIKLMMDWHTPSTYTAYRSYLAYVRSVLPVGQFVYLVPLEQTKRVLLTKNVPTSKGVAFISGFQLLILVGDVAKRNNQANQSCWRADVIDGDRDKYYDDHRVKLIHAAFIRRFGDAMAHYGNRSRQPPEMQPSEHAVRLTKVVQSAPLCMSRLISRAIGDAKELNNNDQRRVTNEFMMRMLIPSDVIKPLMRAKINIAYEESKAETEWTQLERNMDFEEKRFMKPKESFANVFVPMCSYITKNNGSHISCPYAERIVSLSPSHQFKQHELVDRSKTLCHAAWKKTAGGEGVHRHPANSPDEFTNRLMTHREGTATSPQIKRNLSF